jgi:hypothetical protein
VGRRDDVGCEVILPCFTAQYTPLATPTVLQVTSSDGACLSQLGLMIRDTVPGILCIPGAWEDPLVFVSAFATFQSEADPTSLSRGPMKGVPVS